MLAEDGQTVSGSLEYGIHHNSEWHYDFVMHFKLTHSISAPMQKVIPTGKGQIAETKSAIKSGIEADSFAWLKDDCKDLVLSLSER